MKYSITKWTIKKLIQLYSSSKLNLSPPYQRNFIWSLDDQKELINSIQKEIPIPSFFVIQKGKTMYEMVDGQQRSRTIVAYVNKFFPDLHDKLFDDKKNSKFLNYEFPVTIITNMGSEPIEKFYALVNKTGIHLNKPEVRKADFYDTNYLKLVNEIASSSTFTGLNLFSSTTLKRMNDVEFIAELVVLVKDGHVDKKDLMDQYFKNDLTKSECAEIKSKIMEIMGKISLLNESFPLAKSRYKQRNDFYTLIDFINKHKKVQIDHLDYFYRLLIYIGSDIKPTNDECEPLKEYARNCVTQSNSKLAREKRLAFFENLLLNKSTKPNKEQAEIMKYYGFKKNELKSVGKYFTLDLIGFSKLPSKSIIVFEDGL